MAQNENSAVNVTAKCEIKYVHDLSAAEWGCYILTFNTAASQTQAAYISLCG